MFHFDLHADPLTNQELKTELAQLKTLRKQQIKYSCLSDIGHALIFIVLYFNHLLSGYAILTAVAISTVIAILVATVGRENLRARDRLVVGLLAVGACAGTFYILYRPLEQKMPGSLIAAAAAGSIVVVGATLGRRIKEVMLAIEQMKPISEDEQARQELARLCRNHPPLEEYRVRAAENLRPNLTYGELAAMREWAAQPPDESAQARSNGS